MLDVYEFMVARPEINYRYFSMPSIPIKGGIEMLNFNNATHTFELQMLGREDGKSVYDLGEGGNFQKFFHWFSQNTQDEVRHPHF